MTMIPIVCVSTVGQIFAGWPRMAPSAPVTARYPAVRTSCGYGRCPRGRSPVRLPVPFMSTYRGCANRIAKRRPRRQRTMDTGSGRGGVRCIPTSGWLAGDVPEDRWIHVATTGDATDVMSAKALRGRQHRPDGDGAGRLHFEIGEMKTQAKSLANLVFRHFDRARQSSL